MSENMKIWTTNQTTDPAYTKSYSGRGGFSGSAINSTYQFRRATETFGPAGKGWGWDIEKDEVIRAGEELLHVLTIRFWWKDEDSVHSFPAFGQTMLASKDRSGALRVDEEAPKKSLTDALTKALSFLGFSSDVYLGLFDDNKYVNQRLSETSGQKDIVREQKALRTEGVPEQLVTAVKGLLARPDARDCLVRQITKANEGGSAIVFSPSDDAIDLANHIFDAKRGA